MAVGGTDFGDTSAHQNNTYWSSTNTATFGSALSYVPEIPWNTTCSSQMLATFEGFATTYGSLDFATATSSSVRIHFFWRTGRLRRPEPVRPRLAFRLRRDQRHLHRMAEAVLAKRLIGNPADTVRDLPDVSMFASFGPWNHAYAICYSDTANQGTPCNGTAAGWSTGWGGTSFGSPIWAGIQALINQYTGSTQGNPNPVLYKLAAAEYGASGSSACNSSNGNAVSGSCIFYDVTAGDMVVPCTNYPSTANYYNCYRPSGTYGVMSFSNGADLPTFGTGTGWDFATGIGTVNVYNLVTNWASSGGGNASLTVGVTGSGTVASNPAGISCPSTCSYVFTGGSQVTLTPTPTSGWTFSSWGGACTGTGTCTMAMNAAESVTATFVQGLTLSVSVTGGGTVTSSPAGINCPSTCSTSFAGGTQVTLTATSADGSGFGGWGGACSGFDNCVVTMSAAQIVTATFALTQYALNVSVAGNGTVTSSPTGITCPSLCTMNYSSGTPVMLTATPSAGATFSNWGGACTGNGSCLVTMNSRESVTAMFSSSGGGPSTQTFVSASLGNDANPCTRQSPCLTFAAAFAQTTAGGEINVLDTGDFGPVTVTKSVTLRGYDVEAGILVSNNNSIIVQAGATDRVVLEGLDLEGLGTGLDGVKVLAAGQVYVLKCKIHHFTGTGVNMNSNVANSSVFIEDSIITKNVTGVAVQGNGVANSGSIVNTVVDSNTTNALLVSGAGNIANVIQSLFAASPNGINLMNGGSAISIGQANVVTGAGAFSSTVAYK